MHAKDLYDRLAAGYSYDSMYGELCNERDRLKKENARLRECLQEFADAIKNDDGFGVDQGWMLERMSEIGIRGQ